MRNFSLLALLLTLLPGCWSMPAPRDEANTSGNAAFAVDFVPLPPEARGRLLNKPLPMSSGKVYLGVSYTNPACLVEYDPKTGAMRVAAWIKSNAVNGGLDRPGPGLLNEDPRDLTRDKPWPLCQNVIAARLFEHEGGLIVGGTTTDATEPDSTRHYAGGHWFAFDPDKGTLSDFGILATGEGIAAICHRPQTSSYYIVTWPMGKFFFCGYGDTSRSAAGSRYGATGRFSEFRGLTTSVIALVPHYIEVLNNLCPYLCDGGTGEVMIWEKYGGAFWGTQRRFAIRRQLGLSTPAASARSQSPSLDNSPCFGNYWMEGCAAPGQERFYSTARRSGRLFELDSTRAKPVGVLIDHGDVVTWKKPPDGAPDGLYATAITCAQNGTVYYTHNEYLMKLDPKTGEKSLCGMFVERKTGRRIPARYGATAPDGLLYFVTELDGVQGIFSFDPTSIHGAKLLERSPHIEQLPAYMRRTTPAPAAQENTK